MTRKYIVSQLGARMHYAVPFILQQQDMLKLFNTDIVADKSWPKILNYIPDSLLLTELKRLKARKIPKEILSLTKTSPYLGLRYAMKRRFLTGHEYENHLWAADTLNGKISSEDLSLSNAIYTFNSAGYKLMKDAKKHGLYCVMEQTIAPKIIELNLLKSMAEMYPDWSIVNTNTDDAKLMIERESLEWDLADKIICGSEFVKDSIGKSGGDITKCEVVPYGVPTVFNRKLLTYSGNRKLRVLVVGQVGLRKGSPCVLNVAKKLHSKIDFRMIGSINTSLKNCHNLRNYIQLLGVVPRDQMLTHYNWADVFFLPSVCEGSATVTYEALRVGLPVVCTKNTGSIVQQGYDGFILNNADENGMANALESLADDISLYQNMVNNTKFSSHEASIEAYSERLIRVLQS